MKNVEFKNGIVYVKGQATIKEVAAFISDLESKNEEFLIQYI